MRHVVREKIQLGDVGSAPSSSSQPCLGHMVKEKIQSGDAGSEPSSSSQPCLCRICREEEEMEGNTMEAPCGCSGTLKFAHRVCIQRWCDEKGDTTCEICLQKFKPDYTLPPKASQMVEVMVTIRGSLEVPRLNYEPNSGGSNDEESGNDSPDCYLSTQRDTSCYRPIPLTIATMFLVWQLVELVTGDDDYPFALTTVLLLRMGGILLPFYLIMWMISAIQHSQWQQRSRHLRIQRVETMPRVEEDHDIQEHIIEIQS